MSGKRGSNPRPSAWEADALPLSYSRKSIVISSGRILSSQDYRKSIFHLIWKSNLYNYQFRYSLEERFTRILSLLSD